MSESPSPSPNEAGADESDDVKDESFDVNTADRDLSSPLDGDESRRDEGVRSNVGFKKWLNIQRRAGNPENLEFMEYFKRKEAAFPPTYNFEAWSERIILKWPDDADDVITYMIRAEAQWRAEQTAGTLTAKAYGIAPQTMANKLTHRTAQEDVRCGLVDLDGRTCNDHVVPGSNRCSKHGGALVDPETRRALLLSSYASLVTHAQTAVDTLVDIMQNSRNDLARVSASKEVLDRVGLTPELNINISVSKDESSPIDVLKKKLDQMGDRLRPHVVDATSAEAAPSTYETQESATTLGSLPQRSLFDAPESET